MKLFNKLLALFLAIIFSAYSVGVCFSIHSCEHCHKQEIYVFRHPDCCLASKLEHHHPNLEEHHTHTASCHNEHGLSHCHKACCISKFKYYKIHQLYTQPQLVHLDAITLFSNDLLISEYIVTLYNKAITIKGKAPPIPECSPISQGGERYLLFTHQQVLYA